MAAGYGPQDTGRRVRAAGYGPPSVASPAQPARAAAARLAARPGAL